MEGAPANRSKFKLVELLFDLLVVEVVEEGPAGVDALRYGFGCVEGTVHANQSLQHIKR